MEINQASARRKIEEFAGLWAEDHLGEHHANLDVNDCYQALSDRHSELLEFRVLTGIAEE